MRINTSGRLMGKEDICTDLHLDLSINVVFGEKKSLALNFAGRNFNEICKISGVDQKSTDELINLVKMREDLDFYKYALNSRSTIEPYEDRLKTIIKLSDIYFLQDIEDDEEFIESFYVGAKTFVDQDMFVNLIGEIASFPKVLQLESPKTPERFSCGDFNITESCVSLVDTPLFKIEGKMLEELKKKVFEHMNTEGKKVLEYEREIVVERSQNFYELIGKMKELPLKTLNYENVEDVDYVLSLLLDLTKTFKLRIS